MQRWYTWLHEVKKKDEERRRDVEHQKLVSRMIKSAEGGTGLLHKSPNQRRGRGRVQILKEEEEDVKGGIQILDEEEEDARPLTRCEEKRRAGAKHWQCNSEVQDPKDKTLEK